jgi:hypothetical protein
MAETHKQIEALEECIRRRGGASTKQSIAAGQIVRALTVVLTKENHYARERFECLVSRYFEGHLLRRKANL